MNRAVGRAALLLLLCLVIACGNPGRGGSAEPDIERLATPTPEAAPSEPGRVRAILESRCRLGVYSAEVEVDYHALGEGGRRITRVRLTVNGRTEFDTGAMSDVDFIGTRTLHVVGGRRYNLQLLAESSGQPVTTANSVVRCPDLPPGRRL
jgi:hypothetical protein